MKLSAVILICIVNYYIGDPLNDYFGFTDDSMIYAVDDPVLRGYCLLIGIEFITFAAILKIRADHVTGWLLGIIFFQALNHALCFVSIKFFGPDNDYIDIWYHAIMDSMYICEVSVLWLISCISLYNQRTRIWRGIVNYTQRRISLDR